MKFLIDTHLPRRLINHFRKAECEALHTFDLPLGNRTLDKEINRLSVHEEFIIVTKDADFVNSFLVYRVPRNLLLVSTGNITNAELDRLFTDNMKAITEGFLVFDFIELNREAIIFHM